MTEGRVKQKERTRQALLSAARELFEEGVTPTMALAAARASVSEATAYRYYSDVRSLMQDSVAERWPGLDKVVQELQRMALPQDRAKHAAEAMARIVLANEAQIRALIALSYTSGHTDQTADTEKLRPAFRLILIEAVVEPLTYQLSSRTLKLLRHSLAVIIGAEAVLSMKDALRTSDRDTIAALGWSARSIVDAAHVDVRHRPVLHPPKSPEWPDVCRCAADLPF